MTHQNVEELRYFAPTSRANFVTSLIPVAFLIALAGFLFAQVATKTLNSNPEATASMSQPSDANIYLRSIWAQTAP